MSIQVKANQTDPREKTDLEGTQDVSTKDSTGEELELEDEEVMDDDDVEDAAEDDEM